MGDKFRIVKLKTAWASQGDQVGKEAQQPIPQICFAADNLKLICEINFWLAAPNVDPGTAVSSLKSERGEAEKRERPTKFLSF